MKHHTVPENLLKQAVKALRFQATECSRNKEDRQEWKMADELEAIMKHPTAVPHIAKTHRPAFNI